MNGRKERKAIVGRRRGRAERLVLLRNVGNDRSAESPIPTPEQRDPLPHRRQSAVDAWQSTDRRVPGRCPFRLQARDDSKTGASQKRADRGLAARTRSPHFGLFDGNVAKKLHTGLKRRAIVHIFVRRNSVSVLP
jgi:hypothetical protein